MSASDEETLDLVISYILMGGVVASVILESYGLFLYCRAGHGFAISWDPSWRLFGKDFFTYTASLLLSLGHARTPDAFMALGLIILMLTPYVRVVVSALFFAAKRDWKYFSITFFVLAVLTLSLIRH